MTRPARSSKTAGSGMPATMALTAAVSTGLLTRTSSREATASCNRHGTSAAAAMQAKTATARSADRSPSTTSTASARAAASRTIAECRNRSGHEGRREEEGASMAIRRALSIVSAFSDAGVATFFDKGGLALRLGLPCGEVGYATQPLHSRAHYNLAKRQQDYRYDERRKIIENAKQ